VDKLLRFTEIFRGIFFVQQRGEDGK
jgi:hypothetical protein